MHKTTDGHPANPSISPLSLTRNGNAQVEQPRREDLKSESQRAFSAIVEFVEERSRADGDLTFRDFECELGRRFRPAPPIARNLTTLFGVVRY
jgi:hypothetical protein